MQEGVRARGQHAAQEPPLSSDLRDFAANPAAYPVGEEQTPPRRAPAFQNAISRAVLWPESFRGVAPSAPSSPWAGTDSPAGIVWQYRYHKAESARVNVDQRRSLTIANRGY